MASSRANSSIIRDLDLRVRNENDLYCRESQNWNLTSEKNQRLKLNKKTVGKSGYSTVVAGWIKNIKTCRSSWEALDKLNASGVNPNIDMYNAVLNIAARESLKNCREIFYKIESVGLSHSAITFSTMFKAARLHRDLGFALEFWTLQGTLGIVQTDVGFNTMISCCAELPNLERADSFPQRRIELAESLFSEMCATGISPTTVTYGAMLHLYAKAGMWARSEELVYRDMPESGIKCNEVCLNSLLNAYYQAGELNRLVVCFERIRRDNPEILNLPIWCSAMSGYLGLGRHEAVRDLWDELPELGLKRNNVAVTVFGQSLARQGSVEELKRLSEEFEDFPWPSIIHELYYYGDLDQALEFFQSGYEHGKLPIWSLERSDTMDLHGHNSAVSCVAVRHVLLERARHGNKGSLNIVIGRQNNSGHRVNAGLGDCVRPVLNEMGVAFSEISMGGELVVSGAEINNLGKNPYSPTSVTRLLEDIKNASGAIEKKEILERHIQNELLKRILRYGSDPLLPFNIVKVPKVLKRKVVGTETSRWDAFFHTADACARRKLSGNSAITVMHNVLQRVSSEEEEWMRRILKKNLAIGASLKTVSKIFPGLIPEFNVALAQKFDAKRLLGKTSVAVEPKLDGIRCFAIVDAGAALLYARSGKLITNFDGTIGEELSRLGDGCYDGEIMGKDFVALMRQAYRKEHVQTEDTYFAVFDFLPLEEWHSRVGVTACSDRYAELQNRLQAIEIKYIRLVARHVVSADYEHIKKLHDQFVLEGYEGAMVKDLEASYKFGRGPELQKLKAFQSVDLQIEKLLEGTGKHEGKLGSVVVLHKGVEVQVGSGFSDELREQMWKAPEDFVGRMIETRYQEVTSDGSLRFPTFVCFRNDR